MQLKLKHANQTYSGELVMYREIDNDRLLFSLELIDSRLLLIEFSLKTAQWLQIGGDPFDGNFQSIVFDKLSKTSIFKLLADEQPTEQFYNKFSAMIG